jgi:hypothetical protein
MSIFVSIASYEDPGLLDTIDKCLTNAKYPENIVFGLALMYKDIPDLSLITNKKIVHIYDPETRPGLVKIRNSIKESFSNEDYFLQIDSHTTFIKNWDIELINDLKKVQTIFGKKSIISKQVHSSIGDLKDVDPHAMRDVGVWTFDWKKNTVLNALEYTKIISDEPTNNYTKTNYASCHFLFGDRHFIRKVRFDDVSHFQHEEVFLGFLIYIQGYDIYQNNKISHIGHDPFSYNEKLYGKRLSQETGKVFVPFMNEDPFYVIDACNNFVIHGNNEVYNNFNFKRPPESFWKEIGLHQEFLKLLG